MLHASPGVSTEPLEGHGDVCVMTTFTAGQGARWSRAGGGVAPRQDATVVTSLEDPHSWVLPTRVPAFLGTPNVGASHPVHLVPLGRGMGNLWHLGNHWVAETSGRGLFSLGTGSGAPVLPACCSGGSCGWTGAGVGEGEASR